MLRNRRRLNRSIQLQPIDQDPVHHDRRQEFTGSIHPELSVYNFRENARWSVRNADVFPGGDDPRLFTAQLQTMLQEPGPRIRGSRLGAKPTKAFVFSPYDPSYDQYVYSQSPRLSISIANSQEQHACEDHSQLGLP